jgi:hypothetical protein
MFRILNATACAAVIALAIGSASETRAQTTPESAQSAVATQSPAGSLARYQEAERLATAHLAAFDTLDFDVYSNQKWDRLSESHSPDILVHYPDGHTTTGLPAHIKEMAAQFTFAPDTHIDEHPVRIATGEWTAVTGIMKGTFSRPMHMPNGKVAQPTGKSFALPMVTVGHWVGGVMDEEYLFYDNQTFMQQIGLAQ